MQKQANGTLLLRNFYLFWYKQCSDNVSCFFQLHNTRTFNGAIITFVIEYTYSRSIQLFNMQNHVFPRCFPRRSIRIINLKRTQSQPSPQRLLNNILCIPNSTCVCTMSSFRSIKKLIKYTNANCSCHKAKVEKHGNVFCFSLPECRK